MKPLTKYALAVLAAAAWAVVIVFSNNAGAQPVPITTSVYCDAKTTITVTKLGTRPYDVAIKGGDTVILGMSAHSYFGANKPTPPDFLFAILPQGRTHSNFLVYKDRLVIEDTGDMLPFCGSDTAVPTLYRKVIASGPDFFQTRGLAPGQTAAMKMAPMVDSETVGHIPFNGQGIRNLGCSGGWCLVEWNRIKGYVQVRNLAEGRPRI